MEMKYKCIFSQSTEKTMVFEVSTKSLFIPSFWHLKTNAKTQENNIYIMFSYGHLLMNIILSYLNMHNSHCPQCRLDVPNYSFSHKANNTYYKLELIIACVPLREIFSKIRNCKVKL